MNVHLARAFDRHFILVIEHQGQQQSINVQQELKNIFTYVFNLGESAVITLP